MQTTRALAVGLSVSLAAMAAVAEDGVRWMNGTWCSIGTSISWYNGHPNGKFTHGYQDRVCEVLKFDGLLNVAISGAYLAQSLGSAVRADFYTIEHGLNDWGSTIPVGTIDDYRNNAKNGTFCATYRQMIDEIRGLNPAAKIILCTPRRGIGAGWFPMSSDDPCTNRGTPGTYLKDYVDAIKAIAEEESLPVADFYTTCGTDAELPSLSQDNAVHPNDAGYQLMADELIRAFANVDSLPDPTIPGGVKWRKSVGLLTEVVDSGAPWELALASSGLLTVKTVGDSSALDLTEVATGGPVGIKLVGGIPSGVTVTLPEGAQLLEDAELKWSYEGTTLAEIVASGTPWMFSLNSSGSLTKLLQIGDNPTLDLRNGTLPENAPQITSWAFSTWSSVGKDVTTCQKVLFPEGLTSIASQGLYYWTSLSEIVWPENLTTIGAGAFQNHAVVNMVVPDTVRTIGAGGVASPSMVTLHLPPDLQAFGAHQGCSNLETIDGGLPQRISSIEQKFLYNCKKLTTPIEIGFGTDEMGCLIPVTFGVDGSKLGWTFINCNSIPSIKYGPGVTTVPFYACYGITGLEYLELGENVTAFNDSTKGCSALTNIVITTTNTLSLSPVWQTDASFQGANLREITWNGWFKVAPGATAFKWNDRQVRFVVPGDNMDWVAFMYDSTKVTPWATVVAEHPEYGTAYYATYGEDAREPVGLSIAATGFPATWIVTNGAELDGYALTIANLDSRFGTIAVTPAPPASGLYAEGTEVTVSISVEPGVTFRGWSGDVAEEDRTKTTITLTMDDNKALAASIDAAFWAYADGVLTDGSSTFTTTGTEDALTVSALRSLSASGEVDFSKPINGGSGKISKLATALFNGNKDLVKVILPDGLEQIGANSFYGCTGLTTVENAFPESLRTFEHSANGARSFYGCANLESPMEFGFGTDAEGDPIPVDFSPDSAGWSWIFWDCPKIPSVKFGPGIVTLPQMLGLSEKVKFCELHVLTNRSTFTACTNIAIKTEGTICLKSGGYGPTLFSGSALREITWNCWFEVAPGTTAFSWADRQVRFVVPGDNVNWASFMADSSKMTPWTTVIAEHPEYEAAYYATYGEDARAPEGLSIATTGFPATWIVSNGAHLDGHALQMGDVNPLFGSVSVTPAPTLPGGLYEEGTEVTVELSVVQGVDFLGWTGSVSEEDRMKTTLTLTMDGSKTLTANLLAPYWILADGMLTDGQTTFSVSGNADALTLAGVKTLGGSGLVDLSKPINGGSGKIVKLATALFSGNKELVKVILPDGLEQIGANSFYGCTGLTTVENAFPESLRKFEYEWNGARSFYGCSSLVSPVELGFGTDQGGNPIPVDLSPDGPNNWCWIFYDGPKIPSAKFGPGITTLPPMLGLCDTVKFCELHALTNKSTFTACTNIAVKTEGTIYLKSGGWGSALFSGSALREITWNCWFEVAPGTTAFSWADKQVRFVVPHGNAAWRAFAADAANVTPWAQLDAATKKAYRDRFGKSRKPFGLITGGAYGLPQTWLVIDGWQNGLMMILR